MSTVSIPLRWLRYLLRWLRYPLDIRYVLRWLRYTCIILIRWLRYLAIHPDGSDTETILLDIFVDGVDIFIDTVTVCIGQCMPDVASAAACDATHNTSSPVPVRWQWLYDSKSDAPSSSALSSPALSNIASLS